jgi:hypothetical protein
MTLPYDAVERLVGCGAVALGRNPVPDRAQIVAEVDLAGRLDSREDAWHRR